MITYGRADAEAVQILRRAIDTYHPKLPDEGVGVGLLFAWDPRTVLDGKPAGPALTHQGYTCAATIQKVPKRWGVFLPFAVLVVLDWHIWLKSSAKRRLAILDHELSHLAVDRNKDGETTIAMRSHDLHIGGFRAVAERHGIDALEVMQVVDAITGETDQPWLPGFEVTIGAPVDLGQLMKGGGS